jgi:precorrin-6B C5,15-methyltransferase / cobalt-precorrin-6B C5,C15-methyltransferase
MHGGQWFGTAAGEVLRQATVLIGAARHLAALPADLTGEPVELGGALDEVLDQVIARRDRGERVCLVVSGDPGFFGLTRLARARMAPGAFRVYPAPSSVALAFARAGMSWDDAVVVTAHGRPLEAAIETVLRNPKVAVLTGPGHPPERLGGRLVAAGCAARNVVVASRLEQPDEHVWTGDLSALAAGSFDPLSVVLCLAPGAEGVGARGWAWGLPDDAYDHRAGMITKAEVRAVALGKLRIPAVGVLWDVGAGSGSVAAECAHLAPGLRIYAIERRDDDVSRLRANLAGTAATVVHGQAPETFAGLPDPDRVFVGGGGLDVLAAALDRLRAGGVVVATYAAIDRASGAAGRLGHVVQVSVSRGVPIGPGGALRLAADNPVFVCWGPAA